MICRTHLNLQLLKLALKVLCLLVLDLEGKNQIKYMHISGYVGTNISSLSVRTKKRKRINTCEHGYQDSHSFSSLTLMCVYMYAYMYAYIHTYILS